MILEHAAIWTDNLERLKDFYVQYLMADPAKIYQYEKEL